jgi:adenylate cyclase
VAAAKGTRRKTFGIALGIIVMVTVIYLMAPDFFKIVEFTLYDQHFKLRGARGAHPQVAVVAIDEASLRSVGRWPWSRSVQADLVRKLEAAGAAVIAFDVLLTEPEKSGEQEAAARIAQRMRARGAPAAAIREAEQAAAEPGADATLAQAIAESGRVVLASNFVLSTTDPTAPPERRGAPVKSALGSFKNYAARGAAPPIAASSASFPIPPLLAAAASVGHVNMLAEVDGSTRYEGFVVESNGYYYPSLALEAVRVAAGLDPFALKLDFGNAVLLGDVSIPIDARARVLVDYAGPPGTMHTIPAVDILHGRGVERVKDRMVFIGATAEGTYDLRVTPVSPIFPGVEKHANVAANIIDGRFIVRPKEIELVELAGIVALPLALAFVLPLMRPLPSIGLTLGLWAAVFAGTHLAFRQGVWIPLVYPSLALALTFVAVTIYRFLTEERQRLWTKRAFQQYVSPEVVERIMQDPAALQFGGEVRNMTVLFSDIRDFTTITERHSHDPHIVVQMLREYLTSMTAIVLAEGGTLDKYIGDAVMALFNAPVKYDDHALRGCRAALAMNKEVERLTEKWLAEGKEPFRIGLGVNTGNMVVGNLGSEQLFDYTVIGDEVNLGARLESLNKDYQTTTHIIISDATAAAARDGIEVRELGEVKVKGKTRPVVIYELLGLANTPPK